MLPIWRSRQEETLDLITDTMKDVPRRREVVEEGGTVWEGPLAPVPTTRLQDRLAGLGVLTGGIYWG